MRGVPFAFWTQGGGPPPSLAVTVSKADPDPIPTGGSVGLTAVVLGGSATVTWTIQSGPGSLSLVTGTTATFDADAITTGDTVIRGTHVDDSLVYDEVTVTTSDYAVTASQDVAGAVPVGGSVGLTAVATGGVATVTWSVQSGPGTLSGETGTTAVFDADATTGGPTVIRATHDDDAGVFYDLVVQTYANPTVAFCDPDGANATVSSCDYYNDVAQWRDGAAILDTGGIDIIIITDGAYFDGAIGIGRVSGSPPHMTLGGWAIQTQFEAAGQFHVVYRAAVTPVSWVTNASEQWRVWVPAADDPNTSLTTIFFQLNNND